MATTAAEPAAGPFRQLPLLEVRDLTKVYGLWTNPSDRLVAPALRALGGQRWLPPGIRTFLGRAASTRARDFTALESVSFTVGRGESLGIIGRNGAGKSTLLQLVAGTLTPTDGSVERRGRVAALLELGSGFNPEFTGRENVLLQAALLGKTRTEALARFPEIEAFAEIGDFVDRPVKTYSSGMMVRLAFASQTVLDPDLFIVDEALAVGDVFFQARCARFFRERLAAGMSLLLVSHDLPSVKTLCREAIVLHAGKVSFHGPSADAVSHYHALHRPRPAGQAASGAGPSPVVRTGGAGDWPRRNWPAGVVEVGSREAEVVHVRLEDAQGAPATVFARGQTVRCLLVVESRAPVAGLILGLEIASRHDLVVHGVSSVHLAEAVPDAVPGVPLVAEFSFRADLGVGEYLIDVAVGAGDRGDGAPQHLLHRVARVVSFAVHHGAAGPEFFGVADLGTRLRFLAGSGGDGQ